MGQLDTPAKAGEGMKGQREREKWWGKKVSSKNGGGELGVSFYLCTGYSKAY